MITIAITGGYATGKTVVANMFAGQGAEVICADRIAHMAMQPYTTVWEKLVRYFGKDIVKKDGQIDRRKLAKIVFSDKKKMAKLNELVHPSVKEELKRIMQDRELKGKIEMLAVDIPLLFEVGLEDWFTKIVVVTCNRKVQFERANKRNNISKGELLARIKTQWPLSKKRKMADFVVDNSGTMAETRRQAVGIWKKIKETTRLHTINTRNVIASPPRRAKQSRFNTTRFLVSLGMTLKCHRVKIV